jgi:hypothetical protein
MLVVLRSCSTGFNHEPQAPPHKNDGADTAAANRAEIQNCLNASGYAVLGAGVYPIDTLLDVPAGATLSGTGRAATIQASGNVNGHVSGLGLAGV